MTETPSVLIMAKCPLGHEIAMYPEKCLVLTVYIDGRTDLAANWECPNCPKDNYKHEVEIDV